MRLALLGLLALCLLIGAMAVGPYADYTTAQERVQTLVAQRAELDEAVVELQSEADRLNDPAALEEPAREHLGMARPGEIPYIVVNPPAEPSPPADPALEEGTSDEVASRLDRVIEWLRSLKF